MSTELPIKGALNSAIGISKSSMACDQLPMTLKDYSNYFKPLHGQYVKLSAKTRNLCD